MGCGPPLPSNLPRAVSLSRSLSASTHPLASHGIVKSGPRQEKARFALTRLLTRPTLFSFLMAPESPLRVGAFSTKGQGRHGQEKAGVLQEEIADATGRVDQDHRADSGRGPHGG